MMNYSKAEVKQDNKIRLAKYDTLYIVCFVYIVGFGLSIFSYFAQPDRPPGNFISYAASVTGITYLFVAITLPFILSWQNKKYTKIYKSEINKPEGVKYYGK